MDLSSLTTENIIGTIGAGVALGIIGVWKYLSEKKAPTAENGDRIIPGVTIADMEPIRGLAREQAGTRVAVERIASAIEKLLTISQERAEDEEIVRRAEILAQNMLKQLQATQQVKRGVRS